MKKLTFRVRLCEADPQLIAQFALISTVLTAKQRHHLLSLGGVAC